MTDLERAAVEWSRARRERRRLRRAMLATGCDNGCWRPMRQDEGGWQVKGSVGRNETPPDPGDMCAPCTERERLYRLALTEADRATAAANRIHALVRERLAAGEDPAPLAGFSDLIKRHTTKEDAT